MDHNTNNQNPQQWAPQAPQNPAAPAYNAYSDPGYGGQAPTPGAPPDTVGGGIAPQLDGPNGLKSKWAELNSAAKAGIIAGGVILSLVVVVRILPALIAAVGIGALILLLFVPYWLPTIIAFKRDHKDKFAIALVNMFFGWTFLGWIISLVWAASNSGGANNQQVVVNTYLSNATSVGAPAPAMPGVAAMPAAQPAPAIAPQSAPAPVQYQVGDVVNGHRFNGATWEPVR